MDKFKQRVIGISPVLILLCGLSITTIASYATYLNQSKLHHHYVEQNLALVRDNIQAKIKSQVDMVIRPTQGLFNSSNFVDINEFSGFIKTLHVPSSLGGLQAVANSPRLLDSELDKHVKFMKLEGSRDYHIWPRPEKKTTQDWFPITYIEPLDSHNKNAVGYDVSQENKRRLAMDLARDTDEPTMTQQLSLVQNLESGFIVYAPLYKKNMPTDSIENRRKALSGFISGVFQSTTIFDQIVKNLIPLVPALKLRIYDGAEMTPDQLFYSFSASKNNEDFKEKTSDVVMIEVANRKWMAQIATSPASSFDIEKHAYLILFFIGLLLSLLSFLLTKYVKLQNLKLSQDIELLTETKKYLHIAKEAADSASSLKTAFLANMSHEIRTPLSVIVSSCYLMQETANAGEKEKFTQIIERNGMQLLSVANDILDLTKIETGIISVEYLDFAIRTLLNDMAKDMNVLAHRKNISFEAHIAENIPEVFGTDPTRLRQILQNIIGNAIKFTQQGTVKMTAELAEKNYLRILVEDSGIGITAEQQKLLFQAFSQADVSFTRKYGGTGLGLLLSKKLAHLLGGELSLKSSQSSGSVFEILIQNQLQVLPSEPSDIAVPHEVNPPLLIGKKILLVEDSLDNQFVVTRILEAQGAKVEVAQNGSEGLEMALQSNFDLILMDIQMPVMDGFTATKSLRIKGYRGPIIALTAHTQPELEKLSIEAGFNHYLSKPFQFDQLIKKFKF